MVSKLDRDLAVWRSRELDGDQSKTEFGRLIQKVSAAGGWRTPATPLSVCPEIFDFYPSGAHEFWVLGGANRTYLIRRPEHIIVLFRSLFKSGAFCNKKRILSQC